MWPRKAEYQQAVRNPAGAFDDPELASAQPELESDGMPRVLSGGHAAVFLLKTDRGKVAVRCFLNQTVDRQSRYAAITKGLAALKTSGRSPFARFEYVQKGICVQGMWYPILKMDWTEGLLLCEYLHANWSNSAAVRAIADKWLSMSKLLRSARIAHGNLQPPNIFVGHEIKLIDYDGVFVPSLQGRQSEELGSVDYQHPKRTHAHFGEYIDNFSDWVIYCSLVAISTDPRFCKFANFEQNQLLFRRADFVSPPAAEVFFRLKGHRSPELRTLGTTIEEFLQLAVDLVPQLHPPAAEAGATLKDPVVRIGSGDTVRRVHKDVLDLEDTASGAHGKVSKPVLHVHPALLDDSGSASSALPPPRAAPPSRPLNPEEMADFSGTFPRLNFPKSEGSSSSGIDSVSSGQLGAGFSQTEPPYEQSQTSGGFSQFESSMSQTFSGGFGTRPAPAGFDLSPSSPQTEHGASPEPQPKESANVVSRSSLRAATAEPQPEPKSSGAAGAILVALVVLGLAGGGGAFYWLNGRTPSSTSASLSSSSPTPAATVTSAPADPQANSPGGASSSASPGSDTESSTSKLVEQGLSLLQKKEPKQAIGKFNQAIAAGAANAEVYGGRAEAFMAMKRYAEALDDYNKALTLDPENKQSFRGRGLAFLCLEQYLKAAADFKKAISLGVDESGIYSDLGKCYGGLGEFQAALDYFNQSLERKENANTLYLRGGTFYCLKKYAEAESDYRKAVSLNPKDADAWYGIGSCLYCFKRYSDAKEPFRKAVELYKANGKKAWAAKAEAFLKEVSAHKK